MYFLNSINCNVSKLSSFIITLAIILLLSVIAGFIFLLDPESHTIHVIVDILFRVLEPAANLFIVYFLRIEEPRKVAIRSSAQVSRTFSFLIFVNQGNFSLNLHETFFLGGMTTRNLLLLKWGPLYHQAE